jgi:hypothetical protein
VGKLDSDVFYGLLKRSYRLIKLSLRTSL